MNQRGFTTVLILIVVTVLVLVGYLYYKNQNKTNTYQSQQPTSTASSNPTSYKHNPNDTSLIGDFLKYPNMTFVHEKVVPPCSSTDEFNPCSAITYTWKTQIA